MRISRESVRIAVVGTFSISILGYLGYLLATQGIQVFAKTL
jgi:hypothetical protein